MNNTSENTKTMYILFADIKGYSANKENLNLLAKIEDLLYGYGETYFDNPKENCFKVLGDGMLATSYDCAKIAQAAIEMIENLKEQEKNDKFKGFIEIPQIRIALHVAKKGKVRERRLKDQTLKDVAGETIIETARIEPIVMPNEVFCSEAFANILEASDIENIQTTALKNFKLGKTHDPFEINLLVLHRKQDTKNTADLIKHVEEKLAKPEKSSKLAESIYYFSATENYNFSFTDNSVDNSRNIKAGIF